MAWEKRGKQDYLYRSVREGGRVRKQYLGKGADAQALAAQKAAQRIQRCKEQLAAEQISLELAPLDQLTELLDTQIDLLLEVVLTRAGLHNHKGQWRRRHGREKDAAAE